ncbi:TetR/AcrR family transcriptional regulator [Acinetobacter rongchengensis]|uniref:TetR/AcrR family transcriptional regulator n=1 Tax=Acinetobacter rongchengensis TaxID=2419601 RepID=A0A3A8EWT4_9GAMM|nr:TetR/AcrR family transcriptional regulator [Acinetobacter rongchengensis]RKG38609.1 TetR/AcrR family transcriptional regulator [Acinetobacter rongchengensis]
MKRSNKSEATRQHILDTSFELVLRKGFVGVGLQEILKACGVPKGSFYYYFESKEAFGCALLAQYIHDYKAKIEQIWLQTDGSAYARLMALWQAWIEDPVHGGWAENCLIVKLAAEVSDLSEDMRKILNFGVTKLTERVASLLHEGQQEGSIPKHIDPNKMAQVMYQLWLGAALLAKLAQDKAPLHLALETTQNLLDPIKG